jgi:hypothetical protein
MCNTICTNKKEEVDPTILYVQMVRFNFNGKRSELRPDAIRMKD